MPNRATTKLSCMHQTDTYMCMYIIFYIYIHVQIHVCTNVCMCVDMSICMSAIYTYIHMYVRIHRHGEIKRERECVYVNCTLLEMVQELRPRLRGIRASPPSTRAIRPPRADFCSRVYALLVFVPFVLFCCDMLPIPVCELPLQWNHILRQMGLQSGVAEEANDLQTA